MFSTIKSYITVASLIIAILASCFGGYMSWHSSKLKEQRDNANDELRVKTTLVTKYKNDLGQEVTKTIEYKKTVDELRISNDSTEKELYKVIAASKSREKDIEEAYVINVSTKGGGGFIHTTAVDSMVKVSTIPCKEVRLFDDGFMKIIVTPDSLTYENMEAITLLKSPRRIERKFVVWRWFGWKKTIDRNMVEVVSNNPHSSIDGVYMVKTK